MKRNSLFLLIVVPIIVSMITGCEERKKGCTGCIERYPQLYEANTPEGISVSWAGFNSLYEVDEYLLYHDSTVSNHLGDTIKFYGYIGGRYETPDPGSFAFCLYPNDKSQSVYDDECYFCFYSTMIRCPKHPVKEWMLVPYRMVFVEGTIKECPPVDTNHFWEQRVGNGLYEIEAIKMDSVMF